MLQLADDLFFIGIDDRTGRPRLSPRVFALGLAAARLGELLLEQRIRVDGQQVRVLYGGAPPGDALAHTTLEQIAAEPDIYPPRDWITALAVDSRERVADRLTRAGHIDVYKVRRWGWVGRRDERYPPTDINTAYWPTARLSTCLGQGRQLSWQDAALAGLVSATGLDRYLLYTAEGQARAYLEHILGHLFSDLSVLVEQTRALVGEAVLSART